MVSGWRYYGRSSLNRLLDNLIWFFSGETMLLGKEFLPQAAEIMKAQISMTSPEDEGELAAEEESEATENGASGQQRRQSDHWEKLDEVEDVAIKPIDHVQTPERVIHFKGNNKRIDVYWIADDGGLVLMLPHLLRQAKTPPWVRVYLIKPLSTHSLS